MIPKTTTLQRSQSSHLEELRRLVNNIKGASTPLKKLRLLEKQALAQEALAKYPKSAALLNKLPVASQYIFLSLFAIGQADQVFQGTDILHLQKNKLTHLLDKLSVVEEFYAPIGGIVGYHYQFLQLLLDKETYCPQNCVYEKPPGIDLTKDRKEIRSAVKAGIEALRSIGEIYPVAGAADRLDLRHETTGEPLPAAELLFSGSTLLEGLIRDLSAREYLLYKLTGKSSITPIVLMTSHEKNNDDHIRKILKKCNYFGRGKDNFYLVIQPLVPMICKDGSWATKAPLELIFKPGGHGVLWKLLQDQGALNWLKKRRRGKLLIRQINNPIAGIDMTLLALSGIGCKENKAFGFASCERLVNSSEGMDVLLECKAPKGFEYKITNVEYTDFQKHAIQDHPEKANSPYSRFPANTNILFADLKTIEKTVKKCPIPGLLINMKSEIICTAANGKRRKIQAGRLESTMQNIADEIKTTSKKKLTLKEKCNLPSFITYNKRVKTIAVAKKSFIPGEPLPETPEGAFLELLKNAEDLLSLCKVTTPKVPNEKEYLAKGPSFLLNYHPALGPLYAIISQKIKGGVLHTGSELKLQIAELELKNLELKGSLLIEAENAIGVNNGPSKAQFSEKVGRCRLINVKVINDGIDRKAIKHYWKYTHSHKEACTIYLKGCSEFYAENVTLKGNQTIVVPDGHRLTAVQEGNYINFILEKLEKPSWYYEYTFDSEDKIIVKRKAL